jgi:hypothetical protein
MAKSVLLEVGTRTRREAWKNMKRLLAAGIDVIKWKRQHNKLCRKHSDEKTYICIRCG